MEVEACENTIIVHESQAGLDIIEDWMPRLGSQRTESIQEQFAKYQAILRFQLTDPQHRRFAPERYCFRGSVDDWIPIGPPDTLPNLVARYAKHLGQDSFYELY